MGKRHVEVYYRWERMEFTEICEPVRKPTQPLAPAARAMVVRKAKKDHPWQRSYKNMKPWVADQGVAPPLVGIRTFATP